MMNELFIQSVFVNRDKFSQESYLRGIEVLENLGELEFSSAVTFFTGENGSGKSTLLEGIAVAAGFNPEGGTLNYSFSTYNSHSELCGAIKLIRGISRPKWGYFLRAESFYNVATVEEEYARLGNRIPEYYHKKSHGESFLALSQKNLKPNGLYFLDEPEAALSPQRQLTVLSEICECAKSGSQFIIATHSPILTALPGAEILSFDGGEIHSVEYEDTETYRVTSLFINHREQVLNRLLNNDKCS